MNILLCNDDGIDSEGMLALALMLLKRKHKVTVVAPCGNCSGYAHSVTFYKDVVVSKKLITEGVLAYSLSGTPADCSKFGLSQLDEDFDLVCVGINHGSNLGTEVQYSGTVAAGIEANTLGKKAIAFSCLDYKECDFSRVAEVCGDVIERCFDFLDSTFTLNVNIPALKCGDEIKGYKVTPLGTRLYSDSYDYSSEDVFMLTGHPIYSENPEDCDVSWIEKGYVTMTPVLCDKTHYSAIKKLKSME